MKDLFEKFYTFPQRTLKRNSRDCLVPNHNIGPLKLVLSTRTSPSSSPGSQAGVFHVPEYLILSAAVRSSSEGLPYHPLPDPFNPRYQGLNLGPPTYQTGALPLNHTLFLNAKVGIIYSETQQINQAFGSFLSPATPYLILLIRDYGD